MMKALEDARRDPESLKGRILAAARPVFAARGFHAATTRAIAAEVGIDVSTLYYHWGSKQALFDAILLDLELDFEDRLRVWVRETRDRRLEECFELAVEHFGGFFLDRDRVRVLLFTFFDEESAGKGWAVRSQRRLVQTLKTFVERRLDRRPGARVRCRRAVVRRLAAHPRRQPSPARRGARGRSRRPGIPRAGPAVPALAGRGVHRITDPKPSGRDPRAREGCL